MITEELSNAEYHGEKEHYSSSQLKDILKSPELFYQNHILGRKTMKESPALRIGNAVHCRILEPELYEDEYALFKGKMRKGKAWEEFQEKNKNKIILSEVENLQADLAVNNVLNTDATLPYINGGRPEVSAFTELEGVKIKVRADYINETIKYLQDVKTMSDNVTETNVQRAIAGWQYDLSAALYLDAFAKEGISLEQFIWIFTSTKYNSCKVFKASKLMIENGRKKYKRALKLIKHYDNLNWEFKQGVTEIDPIDYDIQIEGAETNLGGW